MRRKKYNRVIPFLVLVFLTTYNLQLTAAFADVIYDTSGGTLKGLVVEEHRDRIVVSTEGGEQTVLRAQIEEVFYAEPERNYLYLGTQALEGGDFAMAKGFFQKALQINPDLSEAADALARAEDLERKIGVSPAQHDPLAALKKQWGIALAEGNGLAAVSEVRPGSLAEAAGLVPGDGLAAASGCSLAYLPPADVAAELIGPPGSKVKLTLQRAVYFPAGGFTDELKLEMKRLGLTVAAAGSLPLKAQDRILFINGKPTRYLPLSDALQMIQQAKGKGVDLIVHRDLTVIRE